MFCCNKNRPENKSSIEPKTPWRSIYICTAFIFIDGVQFSMYFISMWPYLNTIDPGTTATFFGIITASFSLGQSIASPIFGFWMNKVKSIKPPLTISLIMMMISNLTYIGMEFFPQKDRRYIMLAARCLIGLAAGDIAVMRAYSSSAAVTKDRPRAVIMTSAAFTFGITFGPSIPVIFSPLGYPGWKIFGHLHFDMYTAPAWVSFVNNILSLILLYTIFQEVYAEVESNSGDSLITEPKLNKLAAFICILTRFSIYFVFTNNEAIGSIFSMAMYNWSNSQAVKYYGLIQLAHSGISFLSDIFFVVWFGQFLSRRRLERITTMIGLSLLIFYHIITFPWSFWPNKLEYSIKHVNQTATEITGCYTQTYSWCPSTHQVPLVLYAFSMIFIMAIALGLAFNPVNILFSKILGNSRQGTMTGILFMAGSIARTIGPIIVSFLFDHYGPEATWGMQILVMGVTILIWVIFYRKIAPFDEIKIIRKSGSNSQLDKQGSMKSSKTDTISIDRF